MKKQLLLFYLFFSFLVVTAQENKLNPASDIIITPEVMVGISSDANENFPDRNLQTQFIVGIGKKHHHNLQEWAYRLNAPKTGINFGYTDFGNTESLGGAFTLMPYIEFDVFKRKQKDLKVLLGLGGSYFTKIYDPIENPFNQAVTTDITWSYRATFLYKFLSTKKIDYRLGVTYFHHSNGHTKFPNQGLNSFLGSVSLDIKDFVKPKINSSESKFITPEKNVYSYFSVRYGLGLNALSLAFNEKKAVNTFEADYGKVWNKTYRVGLGFYYSHYQHYQDYIDNNESLVQPGREFENLKDNPFLNASAIGLFIKTEFLLNHVGIDLQIGANIFKPAYRIDWRINEGWDNTPREIPENWQLGEYNTKFNLKHIISSRMGLKYYLIGTDKVPEHNIFVAAHINSNLGQADFSEVSIGYVYSFNKINN